ncbi:MAG: hypothetical protein ACTSSG_03670 [Candidatus Heimdallarchaeaceae archaeon]
MSSFFFVFFRRNIRLYIRMCFISFFILFLPSVFIVGAASFEKLSFQMSLKTSQTDFEIQSFLIHNYSSDNLSLFSSISNSWSNISSQWKKFTVNDSLVFFTYDSSWNESLFVGIDFSSKTNNTKRSTITSNSITIFNNSIKTTNFSTQNYLPFNLDIIINKTTFNNLNLSSFVFSQLKIGYYVDFSTKCFGSFSELEEITNEISYDFRTFLMEKNLGFPDTIIIKTLERATITSFERPFTSITLLFSFITILSVIWLIVIYAKKFISDVTPQLINLEQRGLKRSQRLSIQVVFPIIADSLALLFLFGLYASLLFYLKLEILFAFIISIFVFIFIFYERYKNSRMHPRVSKENIKARLLRYVLILFLISVIFIVMVRTFPILIPPWLRTYINSGVVIVQYYIVTLLIADLLLFLTKKQFLRFNKLPTLISKVLFSRKRHLKSWLHSVVLLVWSLTIITANIQTFAVNYKLDNDLNNLTDVKITVSLPLHSVSDIQVLPEVKFALPISHSEEVYFETYDFYLLDLQLLYDYHPELFDLIPSFKFKSNSTYMSADLAELLDFQEGDLFPTRFGQNQTSLVVNQPIIITKFFPLIKQKENRPFVVAAYRKEFENFTEVNQILIDFRENVTTQKGIERIKKVLGIDFQLEPKYQSPNYKLPLQIFGYSFGMITLIAIGINFGALIKETNPTYVKFSTRGMRKIKIKQTIAKQLGIMTLYSLGLSVILGLIFVYLQMPKMIYQTPLFFPIQIKISFSICITLLVPLLCLTIVFFKLKIEETK